MGVIVAVRLFADLRVDVGEVGYKEVADEGVSCLRPVI